MEKKDYADVWGDTVNLKHLAAGMVIGIVISLAFYIGGLRWLQSSFPGLSPSLLSAYALLLGIVGCLVSAVISAKLFKPKRTLSEETFSEEDRNAVLAELKIDRRREAEELKTADPDIVAEMQDLRLYQLFSGEDNNKKAGVQHGSTISS